MQDMVVQYDWILSACQHYNISSLYDSLLCACQIPLFLEMDLKLPMKWVCANPPVFSIQGATGEKFMYSCCLYLGYITLRCSKDCVLSTTNFKV